MMSWVYLAIAAAFEICWLYSLKFIDWKAIRNFSFTETKYIILLPLLGYVVFGIGNVYFYSGAMKTIPTATAFAVWLGVSLIGTKIVDITYFKEATNLYQLFFLGLILAGIVGLQMNTTAK